MATQNGVPDERVRSIAFYLPQFYPTVETDDWYGPGYTEWRAVAQAKQWFAGHLQPRLPADLGFADLRESETRHVQIRLARDHGIHGFCFAYYWYAGRRVFDRVLSDTLADPTLDLPFCLCWVNQHWIGTGELERQILLEQSHDFESDVAFIRDILPALRDHRYIRFHNRPVLLVQNPKRLVNPDVTSRAWRRICRENGIGDLYLCAVEGFGEDERTDPRLYGFDAAVELPPDLRAPHDRTVDVDGLDEGFEGAFGDYRGLVDAAIDRKPPPYPLHRGAAAGWDDTPKRGSAGRVLKGANALEYGRWLTHLVGLATAADGDHLIFINAWNRWGDGAVLEPDLVHGRAWLVATARALFNPTLPPPAALSSEPQSTKILFVGHDALAFGAELLGLAIVRGIAARPGYEVATLLLAGGSLVDDYRHQGTTFVLSDFPEPDAAARLVDHFANLGYRRAICSTCLSGDIAAILAARNFEILGLMHEMPDWLAQYNLTGIAGRLADAATRTVFANEFARSDFCRGFLLAPGKPAILPQGLYMTPAGHNDRAAARAWVASELGIHPDVRIVMGCGYTDLSKGIDLFMGVARELRAGPNGSRTRFVWVGRVEQALGGYLRADIAMMGLSGIVTLVGERPLAETALFFAAADVFAMTSRSDTFPSVVLEAMQAGVPVVAFDQGTGSVELIRSVGGPIVPFGDVAAMAASIDDLLADASRHDAIGRQSRITAELDYYFPRYVAGLLALFSDQPRPPPSLGRTSVSAVLTDPWCGEIVESLPLRLGAVARQSRLPNEIVIGGRQPSPAEREFIKAFTARTGIAVRHKAQGAGGGRYVGWQTGIEHARGELIWLVEHGSAFPDTFLEEIAPAFADPKVMLAAPSGHGQPDGLGDPAAAGLLVFRRSALGAWLHRLGAFRAGGDWYAAANILRNGRAFHYAGPITRTKIVADDDALARLREGLAIQAETIAARPLDRAAFTRVLAALTRRERDGDGHDGGLTWFFYQCLVASFDRVACPIDAGALLKSRLNILIVTGDRGEAGATQSALRLARVMAAQHSVFLCAAATSGGGWPAGIAEDGIVLAETRERADEPPERTGRLRHFVATHGINVVHSHDWRADRLSYQLVAGTNTPWLITAHGPRYPDDPLDAAMALALPGILNRADGISMTIESAVRGDVRAAFRGAVPRVHLSEEATFGDQARVTAGYAGAIGELYRRTIASATIGGEIWRPPSARTADIMRAFAKVDADQ